MDLVSLSKLPFSFKDLRILMLSQVKRSTKSTMMSPTGAESRRTGKGSKRTVILDKTSLSAFKVAEEFLEPTVVTTYLVTLLGFSSLTLFNHLLKIHVGLKPTVSCIMEFHS